LPTWLTITAFQMLVMLAVLLNSTVQPLKAVLPAVTVIDAVKPEPQLLVTA